MVDLASIDDLLIEPRTRVEAYLGSYLERCQLPSMLIEAVRYALLGGGKRLRPVLCWHSAVAAGGDPSRCVPGASAIELIHAFSLVHDDLPAMDDDDLRRGKPTLHVHAGEAMAILAGDAMLTLAFDLVTGADDLPESMQTEIVRELTLGTKAMITGQVYDTLGGLDKKLDPVSALKLVHSNKTGALLEASCRIGVLSAGGSENALEDITAYARAVGLAFQIVDDLLDVEGSTEQVGKRTGKDERAGKLTYPRLLGVEESRREIDSLLAEAVEASRRFGSLGEGLERLAHSLAHRTH